MSILPLFGYGKLTPCHTDAPKQGTALVFTPPHPLKVLLWREIRRSEALKIVSRTRMAVKNLNRARHC